MTRCHGSMEGGPVIFRVSSIFRRGNISVAEDRTVNTFHVPLVRMTFTSKVRSSNTRKSLLSKIKQNCASAISTIFTDSAATFAIDSEYCPNLYIYGETVVNFDFVINMIGIVSTFQDSTRILAAMIPRNSTTVSPTNVIHRSGMSKMWSTTDPISLFG